jgi:hypothetical protein
MAAAVVVIVALAACGQDVRFQEDFTGGTPTPASLEISRSTATPLPGGSADPLPP